MSQLRLTYKPRDHENHEILEPSPIKKLNSQPI
jgi:hypothetical protein